MGAPLGYAEGPQPAVRVAQRSWAPPPLENFEKEFESMMDTIKYFDTLSIKLDRKTLNLRLKDGKIYKNYYFAYK